MEIHRFGPTLFLSNGAAALRVSKEQITERNGAVLLDITSRNEMAPGHIVARSMVTIFELAHGRLSYQCGHGFWPDALVLQMHGALTDARMDIPLEKRTDVISALLALSSPDADR